jgi:hypothetical protein
MAAITTSPGFGTATWPATRRRAPSGAIPHVVVPRDDDRWAGRRVSPTTYRRRRLAVATSAAACVVVAAMAGVALGGSPLAAPERRPASVSISAGSAGSPGSSAAGAADAATVTVRPGDTLWSIVTRLAPDDDPRPLVDELSSARDGAPLQVGEHIELPG